MSRKLNFAMLVEQVDNGYVLKFSEGWYAENGKQSIHVSPQDLMDAIEHHIGEMGGKVLAITAGDSDTED